jgi:polyphosphate kinase 2
MSRDINPKLEVGDRVVLISMEDPHSPVTAGNKGTVIGVGHDPWSTEPLYYVKWDNGRTLNLIGDEDVWMKEEKSPLNESANNLNNTNPCDSLDEGSEFCKKLSTILEKGRGGLGSSTLKKKMIQFFTELLQGNYTGVGKKIVLEPGKEQFVIRYEELINLQALLDEYGACSKMRKAIENDLESVTTKGLKMVVDDDENYSVLNRIDTHYTFRSYILTLAALDIYEDTNNEKPIDQLTNADIISFINKIALSERIGKDLFSFDSASLQFIDSLIQNTLADEQEREKLMANLNSTRSGGNKVENEVARLFAEKDYQVHNFGQDFGFVDKFGVDMVVVKDGRLHPVQVSSKRKNQPVFFNYADSDCECWAIYRAGKNKFRKEVVLESKEGLINVLSSNDIDPSEMNDLLSQLPDEEVTDLAVRNLERKFLKSGNPRTNARKYLEKLVNSVKNRENIEIEDDDYSVEDELVYGGLEPEKSAIGKKAFKKELLPLQVELLKLQEHIKDTGKSIAVVFEGRDTAGKGSTIRTLTKYLDPKYFNVVALGIPTPEERTDWFGRYEQHIEPGKITFFDRSWYNRGIVEPVMGYGEEGEYEEFIDTVNDFEKSLVSRGVDLYKFWLSITPKTQEKRFDLRKSSPLKYWKFSPNDEKSLEKWDDYTEYKEKVFDISRGEVPWTVVDSNDKRVGSLNLLRHMLKNSDYPDKNEGAIGDTYPESITTINENFIDDMKPLLPLLKMDTNSYVFDFLKALRDSGIVNMMQSPDFTWSGRDFLEKYLKIQELQDSYQQIDDEDEEENLLFLAQKSQQVMIQVAIRNLMDRDVELSTSNINRELRKLGPMAFKYFTMKL